MSNENLNNLLPEDDGTLDAIQRPDQGPDQGEMVDNMIQNRDAQNAANWFMNTQQTFAEDMQYFTATGRGTVMDFNAMNESLRKVENLDGREWGAAHLNLKSQLEGSGWFVDAADWSHGWNAGQYIMADETETLIGTDKNAEQTSMFMAGKDSEAAKLWNLDSNSEWLVNEAASRGIDLSRRGELLDTLKGVFKGTALSIMGGEAFGEAIANHEDPNWNKEGRDAAWEAMTSTDLGRDLATAIGMSRDEMDKFKSQEGMIWAANRRMNDQRFAAHAANDPTGGAAVMMARMAPAMLNDPDLIGELVLAAGASVITGGAAGAGYLSAKGLQAAGMGLKAAKQVERASSIIRNVGKVARFTPTRVTGDLIIPLTKAWKAEKGVSRTIDRMARSWKTMDQYDNTTTFLLGAAGDGAIGGAAQYMLNIASFDALNEMVYGKGNMPTGFQLSEFITRTGMGVFGGMVFGSAMRHVMQGVTKVGLDALTGTDAFVKAVKALDTSEADVRVAESVIEKAVVKSLDNGRLGRDVSAADTASIERVASASIASRSPRAGVSQTRVALRVADAMGTQNIDGANPQAVSRVVSDLVDDAITQESNTMSARLARYQRAADIKQGSLRRQRAEEQTQQIQEAQMSSRVRAARSGVDVNSRQELAEDTDAILRDISVADLDKVSAAKGAREAADVKAREAGVQVRASKRSAKQAKKSKISFTEAVRKIDESSAEAGRAPETPESDDTGVTTTPAENEGVSTPETAVTPDVRTARKAAVKASQEASEARLAEEAAVRELAEKSGLEVDEVDSVIMEAIAQRQADSVAKAANTMINAFDEAGESVPAATAQRILQDVTGDPRAYGVVVKPEADGTIKSDDLRKLVREARNEMLGDLRQRQMDDPNVGYAYSRYIREGSEGVEKILADYEATVKESAESARLRMTLRSQRGVGMKESDFVGTTEDMTPQEYMDAAVTKVEEVRNLLVKAEEAVDTELSSLMAETKKMTGVAAKAELKEAGYNPRMIKELKGKQPQELLAHARFMKLVDEAADAGKIKNPEVLALVHTETQGAVLKQTLGKIQAEADKLIKMGENPVLSEVHAYRIMPEGMTGLRDALFGEARNQDGSFDLIKMEEIASRRLTRVDSEFAERQIAHAQDMLVKLETEDGPNAQVQAARYKNRIKVLNERALMADEVLPAVESISRARADRFVAENGAEAMAARVQEEKAQVMAGIEDALFGSGQVGRAARKEIFDSLGLEEIKSKTRGNEIDADWKAQVVKTLATGFEKKLRDEYDFGIVDLLNGNRFFGRGRQIGAALVEMQLGRRLSGDSVADRQAAFKTDGSGADRAVAMLGEERRSNPLGNMKVRQFVDAVDQYVTQSVEQHVLYDESGNLRQLTEEQIEEAIEYYDGLKNLSDDEFEARLQEWTYDGNPRARALVSRDLSDSPLKKFKTVRQNVDAVTERMYYQAPGFTQHVHDDVIVLANAGSVTSLMGAIGDQIAGKAAGRGVLAGAGGGWKIMATTPGSLSDFLNIRHEAMMGRFEGVAQLARTFGMAGLADVNAEIRRGFGDNIPEGWDDKALDQLSELQTLMSLEQALEVVARASQDVEQNGGNWSEALEMNSWDASSQAVNLAKAMYSNYQWATGEQGELAVDNFYQIMGVDRSKGLVDQQVRDVIFTEGKRLGDEDIQGSDLVEKKADYYAEVWDEAFPKEDSWFYTDKDRKLPVGSKSEGIDSARGEEIVNAWRGLREEVGTMKGAKDNPVAMYLRNKMMKKPVMTRGYGAGRKAIVGSMTEFLANTAKDAESGNAEAKAILGILDRYIDNAGPQLMSEAASNRRGTSTLTRQMATVLASAFADRKDKSDTGNMLAEGLGLPDAETFRDANRATSMVEGLSAEDLVSTAKIDEVNETAIRFAEARGFGDISEELQIGLGRWLLRNQLHVKTGVAPEGQIRAAEDRLLVGMADILRDADGNKPERISEMLDNWGTKQSSETVQAMTRSFFAPRQDVVNDRVEAAQVGDRLSPLAKAQIEKGLAVHSTVTSSAGRGWTSLGQASKRSATRAMSFEEQADTGQIAESHLIDPAVMWGKMSSAERKTYIRQLAVQDIALQLGGIVKPAAFGGPAYKTPTVEDALVKWDAGDDDASRIRRVREEVKDGMWEEEGKTGPRTEDYEESFISDTDPWLDKSMWADNNTRNFTDEPESTSDLGVPHLLVAAMDKTSDMMRFRRIEEMATGKASGAGISFAEMAVPASFRLAEELSYSDAAVVARPDSHYGELELERDPRALGFAIRRDIADFRARNENIKSIGDDYTAYQMMIAERAIANASDAVKADIRRLDRDGALETTAGQRELAAIVENQIARGLREGSGEIAEGGRARLIHEIGDEAVVLPADSQLRAMQALARNGSADNMDTLLGPAPYANLVLKGSNVVPGDMVVGLMPKTVFHQDFSLLGGAIEQNLRFAMWYLQKQTGMSPEAISADFINLWSRRMEASEEALVAYEKDLLEWQAGGYELAEGMAKVNPTGDFVMAAALRDLNPEDAKLLAGMTGIDPRDPDFINKLPELMTEGAEGLEALPGAFVDGLGRQLTQDKVDMGTLVWRTYDDIRAAGLNPKSQPMMQRMWLAYVLQRSIGNNLAMREGFGAVPARASKMFRHGPAGDDRIAKTRKAISKELFKGRDLEIDGERLAVQAVVQAKGERMQKVLKKDLGIEVSTDTAGIYAIAQGNRTLFEALVSQGSRDGITSVTGADSADVNTYLREFDSIELRKGELENESINNLITDESVFGRAKDTKESRLADFYQFRDTLPELRRMSPSGQEAVEVSLRGDEEGALLTEGVTNTADPVTSDNRAVIEEFSDVVMEKRYPSVFGLTKQLRELGVFKDAGEAQKFAAMLAMNHDVLSHILPGLKFSYAGESGTARMVNSKDAAGNLQSRLEILKDMQGMEAVEAFDIVAHEIGHAVVGRSLSLVKDPELGKQVSGDLRKIADELRFQFLRGSEERAKFMDAFIAVHGTRKGAEMFTAFERNILASDDSSGRAVYARGMQEFMAQMYSWTLLSRVDDKTDVTFPFNKTLTAVNRAAGNKIRKLHSAFAGRKVAGKSAPFFSDDNRVLKAINRITALANSDRPFHIGDGKQAMIEGTFNSPLNTEANLRENIAELNRAIEAETDVAKIKDLETKKMVFVNSLEELQLRQNPGAFLPEGDLSKNPTFFRDGFYDSSMRRASGDYRPGEKTEVMKRRLMERSGQFREGMFDGVVGKVRKSVSGFGEGAAMQALSAPQKSKNNTIAYLANLLNPTVGQGMKSDVESGISMQQIHTAWQANWGPALSASIELNHLITRDNALAANIEAAFSRFWQGEEDAIEALAAKNPHAADLVQEAVNQGRTAMERTLDMAKAAGLIADDAIDSMVEVMPLPMGLQKSHNVQDNRMMSWTAIGDQIIDQLKNRALDNMVGDEHGKYIDAQMLRQMGIIGNFEAPTARQQDLFASTSQQVKRFVASQRGRFTAELEELELPLGKDSAEEFFFLSRMIDRDVRAGRFNYDDLGSAQEIYLRHLEQKTTEDNAAGIALAELRTDSESDMDVRNFYKQNSDLGSNPHPVDIAAAKIHKNLTYGGYAHVDSRLIATHKLVEALGADSFNKNPMELLMSFAKGLGFQALETSLTQNHFGVKGMGFMQAIRLVEDQVRGGRINTQDGVEAQLDGMGNEAELQLKELRELENQYRMASMRAPLAEHEGASEGWLNSIAPLLAVPVQLVTSPNWTMAALAVEGTGGVIRRTMQGITKGINPIAGASSMSKNALRDELHNVGLALPYHLTTMGYGYQWSLDPTGKALEEIDPTAGRTRSQKVAEKMKKLSNFAFEWSQLKTRSLSLLPAQQLIGKFVWSQEGGPSKLVQAAEAVSEAMTAGKLMTNKEIYQIARKAGINNRELVKEMYDMGLFDPAIAESVTNLANKFMGSNEPIAWQSIMDRVFNSDKGAQGVLFYDRMKAATGLQQLIFQEINRTNLEPQVGTTIVAATPLKRLWSQLSQYSIMFMKRAMVASGMGATSMLGWYIPLLMGESVYYALNQVKNGHRPSEVMRTMAGDPIGTFIQLASRSPFFGAGTFATQALVDNSLSVAAKFLPEGAPLSSYRDKRSGTISTPGMPAPQMLMGALTGFADVVRNTGTLAWGTPDEKAKAKSGLVDAVTRFAPIDLRQLWAPIFRGLTNEWKTESTRPTQRRSPAAQFVTQMGEMPQVSLDRDMKFVSDAASSMAERRMESMGLNRPSAPETPSNSGGGMDTRGSAEVDAPTAQGPSSGVTAPPSDTSSGRLGPGSASSDLMDLM